jgi:hypothetical protein
MDKETNLLWQFYKEEKRKTENNVLMFNTEREYQTYWIKT